MNRNRFLILALLALSIVLARSRFYRDLPEWDVATYSLIGDALVHGKKLYADIWDMKPPAIFATFAAARLITGSHDATAYLLSVTSAIVAMLGIFLATERLQRGAGLWSAALWCAVSMSPAIGAYLPNTEAFINALLALAIALWLRRPHRTRDALLAGACVGIATLFKHIAIVPALTLIIADELSPKVSRRRAAMRSVLLLAPTPIVWAITGSYFAITNRWQIFFDTNFVFARDYSGSIATNLSSAFLPGNLFPKSMLELIPLIALALFGIAISSHCRILIALCIGTFIAVAAPGQFFDHYYQLWLVPLCLAGGIGACALMKRKNLTRLAPPIVLIGLVVLQLHWFTLNARDRAAALHPAGWFLNVADAGQELRSLLREDETMFAWCDEPQLYLLADKRPPAKGLWKMHMVSGPVAPWLTQRTLEDLRAHPPDLVVRWVWAPRDQSHPIESWIDANYIALPDNANRLPLALYARRYSDLARRANGDN